jgi:hypothetical protein
MKEERNGEISKERRKCRIWKVKGTKVERKERKIGEERKKGAKQGRGRK